MRSSYDSTATLALSPGIRTIFLMVISPSKISGTSSSKQPFQEYGRGTGKNDQRGIVAHFHLDHNRADIVALAEIIGRYLLALGKDQFISLFIQNQNFAFPNLVYFTGDDVSDTFLVFLKNVVFLQIKDPCGKILPQGQNGSSSKITSLTSSVTSSPSS